MITILLDHIGLATGRKYHQISSGIQAALAAGDLRPGDRLPPQRELADALGVTLGTVTRAYRRIDELGLVKGEIGRGTFVVRREEEEFTLHALHNRPDRDTADCIRFDLNFPVPEGTPDLAVMLAELSRQSALEEMLRYQPTLGLARHRRAACRWLERLRLPAAPEQIAITTGAQHGLLVALGSQLSPGDALAVDCYTYPGVINLAGFLHLRLIPVEGDAAGMRPDALAKAAVRHRLKGVYLIPTMHNPTTVTMPPDRRRELAAMLRRLDLLLVEDDVYGGMEQEAQPPVAATIPERSFYLTNLSKTLAPGLRLGFLTVPDGQLSAVERVMAASVWMNPPLMAEIGGRWIDDGTADRVIVCKRLAAGKRMAILAEKLVGRELHFRPGSLHGWLQLPRPWTGETFARQAASMGVQVIPSANFSTNGQQPVEAVRICIGPPKNDAETARGAEILAAVLARPAVHGDPFM
jgi:DNA-binding transcriptional MocR family regulator